MEVCRNPTYLLVVCAFAAEMALLSAFVVFGAKFFENVFQFSKENASIFFGMAVFTPRQNEGYYSTALPRGCAALSGSGFVL